MNNAPKLENRTWVGQPLRRRKEGRLVHPQGLIVEDFKLERILVSEHGNGRIFHALKGDSATRASAVRVERRS